MNSVNDKLLYHFSRNALVDTNTLRIANTGVLVEFKVRSHSISSRDIAVWETWVAEAHHIPMDSLKTTVYFDLGLVSISEG